MFIAAVTLTAAISLEIDLGSLIRSHRDRAPKVTCGIKTVGYRFEGKTGQQFRYAGDTYTIPDEGWIELIADRRNMSYRINNETIRLDGAPLNQFGFGEVTLPSPPQQIADKETAQ